MSELGRIEGSVEASRVVLNGAIIGDIYGAERVVLGAKARVHGSVYYGVIEMALGAEINGKLVPRNGAAAAEAAAPALPAPAAAGGGGAGGGGAQRGGSAYRSLGHDEAPLPAPTGTVGELF